MPNVMNVLMNVLYRTTMWQLCCQNVVSSGSRICLQMQALCKALRKVCIVWNAETQEAR
jgi:hypothetical protein